MGSVTARYSLQVGLPPRAVPHFQLCKNCVLGKDTACEGSFETAIFIHKVMSISKTHSNVMSFCKAQIHKSCFHARHFGFVSRRVS